MKMNRDHRVALWRRAVEILDEARTLGDAGPLVFTTGGGRPLDVERFRPLLRRIGVACVPHGFRSSFRDWAAEETDHPREVLEAALAHVVGNKVSLIGAGGGLRPLDPRTEVRCDAAPVRNGPSQWPSPRSQRWAGSWRPGDSQAQGVQRVDATTVAGAKYGAARDGAWKARRR